MTALSMTSEAPATPAPLSLAIHADDDSADFCRSLLPSPLRLDPLGVE